MHVTESNVLRKLRNGEVVISMALKLSDPRGVELAAMCGFDCIWLGMEHVPNDWHTIENQIRAAKVHNVDTVVRVARGSYSDIIKPLEANASGIMVPHVMSLEDAKQIVRQTRFHPVGRRPADGGNVDGAFAMIDFRQYLAESNEQKFVIIQIEDPEPLQELDAIAKLDGIDIILFGPGDFSHSIGAPGEWDHPAITDARKQVVETARANNKFAGTVGTIDSLPGLLEMGFQFVNLGTDVLGLADYYKKIATTANKLRSDRSNH